MGCISEAGLRSQRGHRGDHWQGRQLGAEAPDLGPDRHPEQAHGCELRVLETSRLQAGATGGSQVLGRGRGCLWPAANSGLGHRILERALVLRWVWV